MDVPVTATVSYCASIYGNPCVRRLRTDWYVCVSFAQNRSDVPTDYLYNDITLIPLYEPAQRPFTLRIREIRKDHLYSTYSLHPCLLNSKYLDDRSANITDHC